MRSVVRLLALAGSLWASSRFSLAAEPRAPRVLVEGYRLERVISAPDVVTPVGLDFDADGRLLVVESHTHQRPIDYDGPAGDRLLRFTFAAGDSTKRSREIVVDGMQQAMNPRVLPGGEILVVTRRSVLRVRAGNTSRVAGATAHVTPLVTLDTPADYPHNGLSGIEYSPDGTLYLGLGENAGEAYLLEAADGSIASGSGGVGAMFACTTEGTRLRRHAIGFWNPFALCRTEHGDLFAVDNDPDARPPCRLLHVVEAGDYGYRYDYGRAGNHPLQAWDGELPGTLPMLHGTGEAPSAIREHQGFLWVTSWGEHRIERFRLFPNGTTFVARREIVVQGLADFRPTGMAIDRQGAIYFGDWVRRDYPVHGQGHIWRLVPESPEPSSAVENATEFPTKRDAIPTGGEASKEAFARHARVLERTRRPLTPDGFSKIGDPVERLAYLQALRWSRAPLGWRVLDEAMADPDTAIRQYALRWICDERMEGLKPFVEKGLDGSLKDEQGYLAYLAALNWLGGDYQQRGSTIRTGLLAREVRNEMRPIDLRTLALRSLDPRGSSLTVPQLRIYAFREDAAFRRAAIQALAFLETTEARKVLEEIALDESTFDANARADALAGLAGDPERSTVVWKRLAEGSDPIVARQARRLLELARLSARPSPDPARPAEIAAWKDSLATRGDPDAGRRLFYLPLGPRCGTCHAVRGRGGNIGPDLTDIALRQDRERIRESIMNPSQEIAPHYQAWKLVTRGGKVFSGIRLPQAGDNGIERYADAAGREVRFESSEIEEREVSESSIMPSGLEALLTPQDVADLLAFFEHQPE